MTEHYLLCMGMERRFLQTLYNIEKEEAVGATRFLIQAIIPGSSSSRTQLGEGEGKEVPLIFLA